MNFPGDFLWGVSQSGFQFEMGNPLGRNVDANTDWFTWVHDAHNINKGVVKGHLPENGPNYWDLYQHDHELAEKLGINAFRLGIEWSRIFPFSTFDVKVEVERKEKDFISRIDIEDSTIQELEEVVNRNALEHYRKIIQDLKNRDMTVIICLNHFTLPKWIHDPITARDTKLKKGARGWLDTKTIIEFTKYVAYIAWSIGDLVDTWVTINEPMVVVESGYLTSEAGFPPSVFNFGAAKEATFNLAVAHSHAYDAIKKWGVAKSEEDSHSTPEVGLIHNYIPVKAFEDNKKADIDAANFVDHSHNFAFLNSVKDGWWDKNLDGKKDKGETYLSLQNKLDFIGLNYYTRNIIKGTKTILARLFLRVPAIPEIVNGYGLMCKPNRYSKDGLPTSDFGWEIYPEGIIEGLKAFSKYDVPIYVTENGVSDEKDLYRPQFIIDTLNFLDQAIDEDHIDVRGYFHWSLIDNYEWAEGFEQKFGLYSFDVNTKERVQRQSAIVYRDMISSNIR